MRVSPFLVLAGCWLLFLLSACQNNSGESKESVTEKPDTHFSPIDGYPPSASVSQKLAYWAQNDLEDRHQLKLTDLREIWDYEPSPLVDTIDLRDSIRYERVWEIYCDSLITHNLDRYNAGVIFLHCGGNRIGNDSLSSVIALRYFSADLHDSTLIAYHDKAEQFQLTADFLVRTYK